ncbi:MAG: phosphoesterase [Candidatus Thorarchaeota archaeon]
MNVIYHANCYDGFGAAWAARSFLDKLDKRIEAKYLSAQYGAPPPEVPSGEQVYLVDFSYPRSTLIEMRRKNPVYVIDHHKTAKEALEGLEDCTFDMAKSGAVLTWEHFFPEKKVPKLLLYIQDRDLWKFELPDSKEFHAYLRSVGFDFKEWDILASDLECEQCFDNCILEGRAILRHQDKMVSMMCSQARLSEVGGYRVPVTNATAYWSEVGEELCKQFPDAPFSASYFDRADMKRQWSLRSRSGFDVSAVAKKFGGGGHQQSAGFETDTGF